ncbi:MAG: hypothetical protein WED32_01040 [Patescibacteria group bacterium]
MAIALRMLLPDERTRRRGEETDEVAGPQRAQLEELSHESGLQLEVHPTWRRQVAEPSFASS